MTKNNLDILLKTAKFFFPLKEVLYVFDIYSEQETRGLVIDDFSPAIKLYKIRVTNNKLLLDNNIKISNLNSFINTENLPGIDLLLLNAPEFEEMALESLREKLRNIRMINVKYPISAKDISVSKILKRAGFTLLKRVQNEDTASMIFANNDLSKKVFGIFRIRFIKFRLKNR